MYAGTTLHLAKTGIMSQNDVRFAEEDIVDQAQRGHLGAFEELYRRNVERVFSLCLRMTRDRERAEDLTQEVFVQAWRRLSSFRAESLFSSWLHRIAANIFLQQLRTDSRRPVRVEAEGNLERYARQACEMMPDTRIEVERAIASLPAGARTVLILRDIEGYTYEEICELTGLALGTVKAQIHRGRKLLQEALGS